MTKRTIEQVLSDHTDHLLSLPGVVGTAQGRCDGQPCIRVFVAKGRAEGRQEIPPSLEGYAVEVVETEDLQAF
jgi:hypothetical protein